MYRLIPVNAITTGFFYLVAILMIATAGGLIESTIASIAAMLSFNYFFPAADRHVHDCRSSQLGRAIAFFATSLIASQLSDRAKRRTREAIARENEMERLYSLSRALLLTDSSRPMGNQIVQNIAKTFDFSAVLLFDSKTNETYRASEGELPGIESKLRERALRSSSFRDGSNEFIIMPIRLGGQPIGSLAVQNSSLSDAALQSLLNLVAIALERAISQEAVNRAEIAKRSEELKSTRVSFATTGDAIRIYISIAPRTIPRVYSLSP
jgi:two-component system sensor histidine kinase KdpD